MSNNSPQIFSDHDKFDGTNWIAWKNMITIAAEVHGAMGYLTGTISNPGTIILHLTPTGTTTTATTTAATSTMSPTSTTPAITLTSPTTQSTVDTPWYSTIPSPSEWKAQNAWSKGLIIYNIRNPVGLGINIMGTVAGAWSSLTSIYDKTTELALLYAQDELQGLRYHDGDNFPNHIAQL
ncbi:hypothetical protein AN958_06514 [Leucoagaricus sp. SymC.cos]|nr:hypothetical protein AN958_06514 [Leucoagaricus sp. SymC.cos]